MKKFLLVIGGLVIVAGQPLWAATSKAAVLEKFYGKLIAVDFDRSSFTVSNSRRNTQEQFNWNPGTKFIFNQKEVGPVELQTNRLLIVHYSTDNGDKSVKKVTIRPPLPGRKKSKPPVLPK